MSATERDTNDRDGGSGITSRGVGLGNNVVNGVLPYTARHQEALDLELSLLGAALKRNGSSHRHTQYHRRWKMALSCLYRHKLDVVFGNWHELFSVNLERLKQEFDKEQKMKLQNKKRQQVFWELHAGVKTSTDQQQRTDRATGLLSTFTEGAEAISKRTCTGITECVARLEYAAEAAFTEIGRGFFLALLTVAVGSTARIRTLLLRLQRYLADQMSIALDKNSCLWKEEWLTKSRNELIELMEETRASSNAVPKASSRTELTLASLRSLGIVLPDNSAIRDDICNDNEESPLQQDAIQGVSSTTPPSFALEELDAARIESMTAQDLGESVGIFMESSQDQIVAETQNSGTFSLSAELKYQVDLAGVDQNAAVLMKLKRKKQADEEASKKEAKKKRKLTGESSSQQQRTAKGTAGKKKKKGGDFFDELFG